MAFQKPDVASLERRRRPGRAITLVLGIGLALGTADGNAAAQSSDPSLVWTAPTTIKRVPKKPQPKARPAPPKTVSAPLLTMRWQVLSKGTDGKEKPVDPKTFVFHDKDKLKLAVKVNQAGYFYVIGHTEAPEGGKIIENPVLIFNGHNYVAKDEEIFIPDNCDAEFRDEQNKCWYEMKPPGGRQVVTLVFSRDPVDSLPTAIAGKAVEIGPAIFEQLRSGSPKTSHRPWTATSTGSVLKGPFITAVWNPNKDDNEDLVEQIVLTHEEQRRK
jgi:hypothetical protein